MKKIMFFNETSPTECYKLNILAAYCVILLILSLIFNSLLLIVFIKYKKLRTSLNYFIIALTLLNLFGSIVQFFFVIPSNIYCRWVFGKLGCYISGFSMYLVGCIHIYLMAAISIERYAVIFKPFMIRRITKKISLIIILICIGISIFWCVMPFFGWSYYSLEGSLTSCSVEWSVKSWNVLSYNLTIWIFAFMVPLMLIIFCNIHMLVLIERTSKIQQKKRAKRILKEKKLYSIVITQISYLVTWSPYAFVSMYSSFNTSFSLSPLHSTLPAMFAKSSMVWSSIMFIFSNKKIREKFLLLTSCRNHKHQQSKTGYFLFNK